MNKIPFGPTYEEMVDPRKIDSQIKKKLLKVTNECNPLNLFNISWKNLDGKVNKLVLQKDLTGVDANIVVLLGKCFPTGSHKVGSAYSIMMEKIVDKEIDLTSDRVIAPSSGNFGIGAAYVSKLMGISSTVVIPNSMSKERYELINKYGSTLDELDGKNVDINALLKRTNELAKDPHNKVLAQFELFSNYRFHRYVTGNSCIDAVKGIGNGKIAAFVSAPGSGGTLAAGDEIKVKYPNAKVVAIEPKECPTLYKGESGDHAVEGVGDKMCTLIHNVSNTDYIALISSEDCLKGLEVTNTYRKLKNLFGISSICNILGAIKMAKYLKLGPKDNIVTIATDSMDRYNSVLSKFENKYRNVDKHEWKKEVFDNIDTSDVLDTQSKKEKDRLYKLKEQCWLPYGYSVEFLNEMKEPKFWENEYSKVIKYDKKILSKR